MAAIISDSFIQQHNLIVIYVASQQISQTQHCSTRVRWSYHVTVLTGGLTTSAMETVDRSVQKTRVAS